MPPLFSIVMPTRNRAKTLEYAIQTALNQSFDDYEIVVSDNCSTDCTAEVTHRHGNSQTRYIRTHEPLAMHKNWEFGLAQALGTYRIVLSDDDGLLPNSLANLYDVIRETKAKVIQWHRAQYNWPKYQLANLQNVLIYTEPRYTGGFVPSRQIIDDAIRYIDCNDTPSLVNSAVHADVFESLKRQTGKLILSYSPDSASGLTIPCVVDEVYVYEKVNSVAGISEFSNGSILLKNEPTISTEAAQEFMSMMRTSGDYTSTFLDTHGISVSSSVLDGLYDVAKHFPEKISLEKLDLVRAAAQSVVEASWFANPAARKQLLKKLSRTVRETSGRGGALRFRLLVLRGALVKALNTQTMRPVSSMLRIILNKPYGSRRYFDGGKHGFANIAEACAFLHKYTMNSERT